mmetsp:Transcript_10190/g.27350  ORF Transcript_10190/g.27350 Transcript_10190/m.27350 type:complete len:196 (+) Transcript_10190:87-674(+)
MYVVHARSEFACVSGRLRHRAARAPLGVMEAWLGGTRRRSWGGAAMRHPLSSSATAADSPDSPHHAADAAANYDADRTHAPHVIGGMKSLESLSSLQSLPVSSIADPASADEMLDVLADAQTAFLKATQADADKIAHAVARASDQRRIVFAALAVEETGMGILEDKALKNHFAAEYVWSKHAKTKTVGIIEEVSE